MTDDRRVQGMLVQERMRKFFRGASGDVGEVDFETKTACYEVKSCCLVTKVTNGRGCKSHHFGRFLIVEANHKALVRTAQDRGKLAKYVFVVRVGGQYIWKVLLAKEVKLGTCNDKGHCFIPLATIFPKGDPV